MNKFKMADVPATKELLTFEMAFPHEEKLTIEQYLSGGSRESMLYKATWILGFEDHHSMIEDNRETLDMFLPKNKALVKEVYKRIEEIETDDLQISILNPYSGLKLFECYLSKSEEPETQKPAKFEVNLFKSYLVLNSEIMQKQKLAAQSVNEGEEELQIPMKWFCTEYPLSDKNHYNLHRLWVTQMVKSIYLFQFLESHEKTKPLLTAFLAHFNRETWQEFLKSFMTIIEAVIMNENDGHTDLSVDPGPDFEKRCDFIEKLLVQEYDEPDHNDFMDIRLKPFYKVEEGIYRIIFNPFVVEKIFKGIYFLMRDVNKTLPEPIGAEDLKSLLGKKFSEEILCGKVMDNIYPDKCIRFSGDQLRDMKIEDAPDYYLRKGKVILLIESDDFLLAGDKKMSFDYRVYKEEFGRILNKEEMPDGKIKPKAVMKLIHTIRKILKNEFSADKGYYHKDIQLYPVLLTHDPQYDISGFNELIDFWFQHELLKLKEEGLFSRYIKPLTIVNIDSLLYNQSGLATRNPLHIILNLYHQRRKDGMEKGIFENAYYPFSQFLNGHFNWQSWTKNPPVLSFISSILFKEKTPDDGSYLLGKF